MNWSWIFLLEYHKNIPNLEFNLKIFLVWISPFLEVRIFTFICYQNQKGRLRF